MRNVDNSLRVEYWQSKAKAMQGRIDELEKEAKLNSSSIAKLSNDVLKMREWAKTVAKQIKELQNELKQIKPKEGDGGGHSNAEAISGQGVAGRK